MPWQSSLRNTPCFSHGGVPTIGAFSCGQMKSLLCCAPTISRYSAPTSRYANGKPGKAGIVIASKRVRACMHAARIRKNTNTNMQRPLAFPFLRVEHAVFSQMMDSFCVRSPPRNAASWAQGLVPSLNVDEFIKTKKLGWGGLLSRYSLTHDLELEYMGYAILKSPK